MLSEEQIQSLYKFCVKHYVRYYDLQVELVDHLANAIESEMKQNPTLDFNAALAKVYKGFGISGFSNLVSKRQASLLKNYRAAFWKSVVSYFTIPRIAVTFFIFFLLNLPAFFIPITDTNWLFIIYYTLLAIVGIVFFMRVIKKLKRPKKSLLVLESSSMGFVLFALLIQLPGIYFNFFLGEKTINETELLTAGNIFLPTGVITLISVIFIAYYQTHKAVYEKARQDYPLAFQ